MYTGILCIDKPVGFTSFDVVAKLRGILRQKRIGHAGTLDPMATGVLPVFLGRATRACDISPMQDKAYHAQFKLGLSTDTQDSTGATITQCHSAVTTALVQAQLAQFQGAILQMPPMYSAIKINGQKLYKLARKGIEIERPLRPVTIYTMQLLQFNETTQEGSLFVECSAGTYVRTICHDLGHALGVGGVMTNLRRTAALGFSQEEAVSLQEVENAVKENRIEELINPTHRVFAAYPQLFLDQQQTKLFLSGARLDLGRIANLPSAETVSVFGADNLFLGIARQSLSENELVIVKNMAAWE